MRFSVLITLLTALVAACSVSATITKYDSHVDGIYKRSTLFSVVVDNTDLIDVVQFYEYDYAHFSLTNATQTVTITVIAPKDILSASVSPKSLDAKTSTAANVAWFNVTGSHYLIVKIDAHKELVILIDPPELHVPSSTTDNIFYVTEYGADSSGSVSCTEAFNSAISDLEKAGKGVIFVPPGVYLVGNIKLPTNASLYLQGGSVLLFTGYQSDYTSFFTKTTIGDPSADKFVTWWIYTDFGSSDVGIYGRGTIDGRAEYTLSNGPFEANLVMPINTTNFVIDGPILRESGSWALTPTMSIDLTVRNVKILNALYMAENDGIDIMHCSGVLVQHVFGATGDDTYSLKTWSPSTDVAESWPDCYRPNSDVVITDTVAWTGCMGWKIGYGNFDGLTHLEVSDGTLYEGAVGIGIDAKYSMAQSSNISDLVYKDITIESIVEGHKLHFGAWLSLVTRTIHATHTNQKPANVYDVLIENVNVINWGGYGAYVYGYNDEAQFHNVTLVNVTMGDQLVTSLEEAHINHIKFVKGLNMDS